MINLDCFESPCIIHSDFEYELFAFAVEVMCILPSYVDIFFEVSAVIAKAQAKKNDRRCVVTLKWLVYNITKAN